MVKVCCHCDVMWHLSLNGSLVPYLVPFIMRERHCHSLSSPLSHTHTLSLSHTHTFSLSHTHTFSLSHTLVTQIHWQENTKEWNQKRKHFFSAARASIRSCRRPSQDSVFFLACTEREKQKPDKNGFFRWQIFLNKTTRGVKKTGHMLRIQVHYTNEAPSVVDGITSPG